MPLTLTITSYQRLSTGQETVKVLDQEGASIGRGPDNDWVLPDPERVVSSRHCSINFQDGQYFITDTSVNGVFINQSEQRLSKGSPVALHDGDELILGDYEIQVSIREASAASTFQFEGDVDKTDIYNSPLSNHFQQPSSTPPEFPEEDPFSGLPPPNKGKAGPNAQSMPDSSDLLGIESPKPPPWWQSTEADHLPAEQEFFQPPEPVTPPPSQRPQSTGSDDLGLPDAGSSAAEQIPADWDAGLEDPFPSDTAKPAAPPSGGRQPVPPTRPVTNEPLIPPFPEEERRPSPAGKQSLPRDIIPEDALGPTPPLPTPAVRPVQPPASPLSPPPMGARSGVETAVPPATPPPSQAARGRSGGDDALRAFLAGAGMSHLQIDEADAVQTMNEMGAIFRQTVQGLMEVLTTRTSIKSEFRLSQTMIRPVENNPLKFSPNVEEAMICLLMRRGPAYLPAVRAVKEGFDDIKAHQLAVMAGVQAALLNLLRRFDPQALETRLGQQSMLDNIMPSKRKARYWEVFTLLYNEIAKEAEDDFQELFGREFARAYQEQINRL